MKKLLALVLISFISFQNQAQNDTEPEEKKTEIDTTLVRSLDKTIKTLYATISGEKDEKRNWKQFTYLFASDAKLIPSFMDEDFFYQVRYLSPKDYIKSSGKWLEKNGFIEKEIHRKVDRFGHIAQVFSTYEAFHSKEDEEPFMRGVNSIQLFNDGERWFIVNIYWTQETDENPIPKKYLP